MLQLSLRDYRRQFIRPLQTAHGPWHERRGVVVRLQTPSGQHSYGEIAPIPGFGTESLGEAIACLTPLQAKSIAMDDLSQIVETLPSRYSATRFGLGMAIAQLQGLFPRSAPSPGPAQICALLPTGAAAIEAWPSLWSLGHRTFKWKLGLDDLSSELAWLVELRRSLPPQARLRLDANGGFSPEAAQQCLQTCDALHRQGRPIEFLEQPLPPTQWNELMALSQTHITTLALDESVTGLPQLKDCYGRGWQGIFVVKGAIAGNPLKVIEFCRNHRLKVVFSSVFETDLARQAVLTMAQAVAQPAVDQSIVDQSTIGTDIGIDDTSTDRSRSETGVGDAQPLSPPRMGSQTTAVPGQSYALGFGVDHWLESDGLDGLDAPDQSNDLRTRGEEIWQLLSNC